MMERLPKQCEWYTMPNQLIAHCGYMCGNITVNGASTSWSLVSQVIENWYGWAYTKSKYWLPLLAKIIPTRSQPHPESECQQSVNEYWSCIQGYLMDDMLHTVIKESSAAYTGKNYSDRLPTASRRWVSMEHQSFLVLHPASSDGW